MHKVNLCFAHVEQNNKFTFVLASSDAYTFPSLPYLLCLATSNKES